MRTNHKKIARMIFNPRAYSGGARRLPVWAALTLLFGVLATCLAEPVSDSASTHSKLADAARAALGEKFGIQIESIHPSAGGYMIDFRFKIVDPDRAVRLTRRETKPFLVDQATGAILLVPRTPKLGALRQAGQKTPAGRVSFVLFSNPGKVVKSGSKVTVVIGDFKVKNLVVE